VSSPISWAVVRPTCRQSAPSLWGLFYYLSQHKVSAVQGIESMKGVYQTYVPCPPEMHAYKKYRRACVPALSLTGRPDEEPRNGPHQKQTRPQPICTSMSVEGVMKRRGPEYLVWSRCMG
jgi:hypothetical protein